MFMKANSMSAIFGIFNTAFTEFRPKDYIIEDKKTDICSTKMANFIGIEENLGYFESNSIAINNCIVIMNILDKLHEQIDDPNTIPMPSFYRCCMKKKSINVFMQLIMFENSNLIKVILNFIYKHHVCKYGLIKCLVENGIIEILMLTIHTRNGKRAVKILQKIESNMSEYNMDIIWEDSIFEPEKVLYESLDQDTQIRIENSLF